MEIAVDGWRSGIAEWQAVRGVPADQLPPLTEAQKQVARKLGIAEQDYARSALAGERTRDALLRKTERLARLIENRVGASGISASVTRVLLRTVEHRFDVELQINGRSLSLRVEETLVDDYFDGGSVQAEQSLDRILDRALASMKA